MNTRLKYLALAALICPALLFAGEEEATPCPHHNHDEEQVIACDCENGCKTESILACKKKHPHHDGDDHDHDESSLMACKKKHPHEGEDDSLLA